MKHAKPELYIQNRISTGEVISQGAKRNLFRAENECFTMSGTH